MASAVSQTGETQACRKGVSQAKAQGSFEIIQTGMGPVNAKRGLQHRLKQTRLQRPKLIISTGFAGSWSSELTPGSWAMGRTISSEKGTEERLSYPPLLALAKSIHKNCRAAHFISLNKPQATHRKAPLLLLNQIPVLADLESYTWAILAREAGIPFLILRVVSDTPDHSLPLAIESFASASLSTHTRDRLKLVSQGISQIFFNPLNLCNFIWKSSKLPHFLSNGWKTFATDIAPTQKP